MFCTNVVSTFSAPPPLNDSIRNRTFLFHNFICARIGRRWGLYGFGPGEGGEVEGEGGAVGRVEGGGGGECADEAVAKGADAIVAGDGGEGGGGGEDGAGES